jgi:beta-phosphoglucomutase-like phosphatase (HAD superfamily)
MPRGARRGTLEIMATAVQPMIVPRTRRSRRDPPAKAPETALQRADELDELSAHWRLALDAAQAALQAARAAFRSDPLSGRANLLKAERTATAHSLEGLAQDFQAKAWRSDLEIPAWNLYRLLGLPPEVQGCVFDLEDVLTGSPSLQVAAWGETWAALSAERGGRKAAHFAPFDPRLDYYAHLHARPRLEGVRDFLASRGITLAEGESDDPPGCETVHALANLKQRSLLRRLNAGGLSAFAGSRRYLQLARDAGLHCAAVSASANTQSILERTNLAALIESTVDGMAMLTQQLRRSPAPDTLLAACWQLDVEPELAAAFVSTADGVAAGRAAGFALVAGIGEGPLQRSLAARGADLVAANLREVLDRRLITSR